MWMLEKEDVTNLSKIILDKNYTEWVDFLRGIFKLSRSPHIDEPIVLLLVQKKLIDATIEAQKAIREGKELLKQASDGKKVKNLDGIKKQLHINKMIPHIMRAIADGLAWRILDYDKPFLRMMAGQKKYPLSVDFTDYSKIAYIIAQQMIERKSKILINDLTNFLRVGDITEKGKITVISELKYKKKKIVVQNVYEAIKAQKKDLSFQELKIHQVQIARDFRKIILPDNTKIPIQDIPIDFSNNFIILNDLLKYARRDGISSREIGKYLFIEVNDYETLFKKYPKDALERLKAVPRPRWTKKEDVWMFSSYDSFYNEAGDFPRAFTPFSIFPLTDYNCMNLIAGKSIFVCYLNLEEIKKLIQNDGWSLEEVDIEKNFLENEKIDKKRFEKGLIYQNIPNEDLYKVKKGACNVTIPVNWVSSIAIEFMDPKVLLQVLNFIYTKSDHSKTIFLPFILGERKVWK